MNNPSQPEVNLYLKATESIVIDIDDSRFEVANSFGAKAVIHTTDFELQKKSWLEK